MVYRFMLYEHYKMEIEIIADSQEEAAEKAMENWNRGSYYDLPMDGWLDDFGMYPV